MKIKFYWGKYNDIEYDYELDEKEFNELRVLAKENLLNSLSGATIEEKSQQIIEKYDWELDEPENIINEMVDIMLADGDFDDLARELFDNNASDEYNESKSYRDDYDYYGVSRWDFF